MKKRYTVGFFFNHDASEVILIKKNRPDWQKGKLNGVGGRIEDEESPEDCIVREFQEETGYLAFNWKALCLLDYPEAQVYFFVSFAKDDAPYLEIKTTTDEIIGWYSTVNLPLNLIPNLYWLIPYALDREQYRFIPYGRM